MNCHMFEFIFLVGNLPSVPRPGPSRPMGKCGPIFLVSYVGKRHGGLYKVSTMEESKRLGGERDQIKFIDLGFERWQVVGFRKARRRQDVP